MEIMIDCYGVTARLTGGAELMLGLPPGARVGDALDALATRWPDLAKVLPGCACAVGDAVVSRDRALRADERLALLPPVSGG